MDLPCAAGARHRGYVVDPASVPVERHKRRAKTDRLDVIKRVINLRAWLRGERDRMHVVRVPLPQDEASRQPAGKGLVVDLKLIHSDRHRRTRLDRDMSNRMGIENDPHWPPRCMRETRPRRAASTA
jgi:hypothetical protein